MVTVYVTTVIVFLLIIAYPVVHWITGIVRDSRRSDLMIAVLKDLGLSELRQGTACDKLVYVKSTQAVDKYTDIDFFKEDASNLGFISNVLCAKRNYQKLITDFIFDNQYKTMKEYDYVETMLKNSLQDIETFVLTVLYTSPAGRKYYSRDITIDENRLRYIEKNPQLLMSKSEYNQYVKKIEQGALKSKQDYLYEKVNSFIDYVNANKDKLIRKEDSETLDSLISQLLDKVVTKVEKIKTTDSHDWNILEGYVDNIGESITRIITDNQRILDYYDSEDFKSIVSTCQTLMNSQKDFNEYIDEKVKSISKLFGTRVTRNETKFDDTYGYVHTYKKTITPFTAEVSAQVFASAENNPLQYVVKQFYPDKSKYPEQIKQLQCLIEELQTLKDAKQIIESYKKEYTQYLTTVPNYVLSYDEDMFYSKLGFATVNEKSFTVEYKFVYTSNGGFAQRSFTVPMTEETIIQLIESLESKLTQSSFAKEQRALMTSKLRQKIKERDDFTCRCCSNSVHNEPNLLLEIDHIIPVAKGGLTEESNLQTLCWRCNRSKSDKIV